jgi:hypothetical protein
VIRLITLNDLVTLPAGIARQKLAGQWESYWVRLRIFSVVRTLPPQRERRVMLECLMTIGATDSLGDTQTQADFMGTML